jgi:hypothetical protein
MGGMIWIVPAVVFGFLLVVLMILFGRVVQRSEDLVRARLAVESLYRRACHRWGEGAGPRYDNMRVAVYVEAEEALIRWGMLSPEQCVQHDPEEEA